MIEVGNEKNIAANEQFTDELRKNPGDPQYLVRLIQSLNQSGEQVRAAKLLKKIITDPDFPTHTDAFRNTAVKCAKKPA